MNQHVMCRNRHEPRGFTFFGLAIAIFIVVLLFYMVLNRLFTDATSHYMEEYYSEVQDGVSLHNQSISHPAQPNKKISPQSIVDRVRSDISDIEKQQSDRQREVEEMLKSY